jgi:alkylhydroperoxidase family enzyme
MAQRIPALKRTEIDEDLLELAAFRRSQQPEPFNIYRTLANHPEMVKHWLKFADALRFEAHLTDRARELLILRTSVNTNCEYEWGQHVPYARNGGVTEAELVAICKPLDVGNWSTGDHALLYAADQLHATSDISNETWNVLADFYDPKQLIEVIMLVGQYHLVAYILNGLRVELDATLTPFPLAP